MRRQTAAAVWPYLQLSIEDYSTPDAALFSISLTNVGVGPAKLQSMRVVFEGSSVQDWAGLIQALTGGENTNFSQNYSRNRVFSPGERVDLFAGELGAAWNADAFNRPARRDRVAKHAELGLTRHVIDVE